MSLNLREIHDSWLPLAAAAYTVPLTLPPGWVLLSTIQPADFGFVAINGAGVRVTVFRGTELEQDAANPRKEWYEDLDFIPEPCKLTTPPPALRPMAWAAALDWGWVHRGFQAAYWSVRDSARPNPRLAVSRDVMIGHSLGVPLACFCAAENHLLDPEVVGFNGPRVGWHNHAIAFDQHIPQFLRVECALDPVHHLAPESLAYVHAGTALTVYPPFSLNVHVNHSLDACRAGLAKLL